MQVTVDENGMITDLSHEDAGEQDHDVLRLRGRALLPGFVNGHSHSFQRGLRGHGETFSGKRGSFWTWREDMYRLVETMTPDRLYELTRQCYHEMLLAGITTVGEFHYLHHDGGSPTYAMDEVILRAASDAGIRLVLLCTLYQQGGIGEGMSGGQDRFQTPSVDAFWDQVDHLSGVLAPGTQSLGVASHSIRAVDLETTIALHEEAVKRSLPFHMHIEEQLSEVEACREKYGQPPLALLNEHLDSGRNFTAVHGTHSRPGDLETLAARGGTLLLCPTTEGNLGDGIPDLDPLVASGGRICLGTDSNLRICMLEEMRWVEYGHRLKSGKRGIFRGPDGSVAPSLLQMATVHGAASLGVAAGAIAPGHAADFIALDLDDPSLIGWDIETLPAAICFGARESVVREICVAGRWLPADDFSAAS